MQLKENEKTMETFNDLELRDVVVLDIERHVSQQMDDIGHDAVRHHTLQV